MYKFRKFLRALPAKLFLLLALIILFSFFANDFALVDIQKTAIILAAGVDRTEGGFRVTAQIAVPKSGDRTAGGTSGVEIAGEGESVAACFAQIYSKTGWVPKLVFCNLLLLGEETGKEDVLPCLDYFLRNEYMPDSCLVAVCAGEAGEFLSSKSAIDDLSSGAAQSLFSDAAEKSGRVMKCSLKEFTVGYFGASGSSYTPFLRRIAAEGERNAGGGSGGSGGSGAPQGDSVYSAAETAIFQKGRMVAVLPPEETFAFALLKGRVFASAFDVEEAGETVSLSILKNSGKVAFTAKGAPQAELSVTLNVRLAGRDTPATVGEIARSIPSPAVLAAAEDLLQARLTALWERCKSAGCDLLHFARTLQRNAPKQYAQYGKQVLSLTRVSVKARVHAVK